MKKLKIVCFSLITIFLLFFSVFSFNVEVKAQVYDRWDAPGLAKVYFDFDGRGVRFYISEIWGDEVSGEVHYVMMYPVRNYYFTDGDIETGVGYAFGRDFFSADLLYDYLSPALQYWDSGETIPEFDRIYVYFDVFTQKFWFEFRGSATSYENYFDGYETGFDFGYEEGLFDGYESGYNQGHDDGYGLGHGEGYDQGFGEGYYVGYYEGIMVGDSEAYEEGFKAGQKSQLVENNKAFYNGIEKWLVPAIITVIALGGFVTIAARKRREQ